METRFVSFGPSPETFFMGICLDSWARWGMVAFFTFVSTAVNDFVGDALVPFITNAIQDHKTMYLPYSKFTCWLITQCLSVYGCTMSIFSIYLLLSQLDFMLIRLLADSMVNMYTTYRFMKNKNVDPMRYHRSQFPTTAARADGESDAYFDCAECCGSAAPAFSPRVQRKFRNFAMRRDSVSGGGVSGGECAPHPRRVRFMHDLASYLAEIRERDREFAMGEAAGAHGAAAVRRGSSLWRLFGNRRVSDRAVQRARGVVEASRRVGGGIAHAAVSSISSSISNSVHSAAGKVASRLNIGNEHETVALVSDSDAMSRQHDAVAMQHDAGEKQRARDKDLSMPAPETAVLQIIDSGNSTGTGRGAQHADSVRYDATP